MRKFHRAAEPSCLAENWERWGANWERRRAADGGARFDWPSVAGEPLNQIILPTLKAQTQEHCSFCDNFVSPPGIDTIEHFRPKTEFPQEAYHWPNLYFCCPFCQQQKRDQFHEALLAPDHLEYEFERFFRWDYTSGDLLVNPQASAADQERAALTIRIYGLNQRHPALRRRELRRRARCLDEPVDEFAYRDFLTQPNAEGPAAQ